jgi:hypothetical protein
MDAADMPQTLGPLVTYETPIESFRPLKPALASIMAACEYMGGVSRAKFYADILPLLDTVKIGKRNFVTTNSIDRLIAANQRSAQSQAGRPETGATSVT